MEISSTCARSIKDRKDVYIKARNTENNCNILQSEKITGILNVGNDSKDNFNFDKESALTVVKTYTLDKWDRQWTI